jgi:hypothetical protein
MFRDSLIKPKNVLKAEKSEQIQKNQYKLIEPLRKSKVAMNGRLELAGATE